MTVWIIEPQEPLIVRDGRPFHATPGARARSLPFPFPSTTAGGVRTRAGLGEDGMFDTSAENIEAVKQIDVRGPLLVEQNEKGGWDFLLPAPADALVLDKEPSESVIERRWLRPLTVKDGAYDRQEELPPYLVGLPNPDPDKGKPSKNAPAFWKWEQFADWLTDPADQTAPLKADELGHDGPQPDRRIHVGINPASFTSIDGALFATSGLTFWHRGEGAGLAHTSKLALAVEIEHKKDISGFAPLGGERRLMRWHKSDVQRLPSKPDRLVEQIKKDGGSCRLILLTPAYFKAGWRPDFGEGVELMATAVSNPVVVSGWDFEKRGPKRTKRLAPAGSVYFVKVKGDIEQWVDDHWMRPLSDDEMGRAGFGLTAVGTWDGEAQPMHIEMKEESDD